MRLSLTCAAITVVTACQQSRAPNAHLTSESRARARLASLQKEYKETEFVREYTHVGGEFAFIGAKLRNSGKLATKVAITADGSVWDYQAGLQRFLREHTDRWGGLSPHSVYQVLQRPKDKRFPYLLWFDPETTSQDEMARQIRKFDPKASSGSEPPIVSAWLDAQAVLELAHRPDVVTIDLVGDGASYEAQQNSNGSGHYADTVDTYNQSGFYGQGINVGIQEPTPPGCRMFDDHEAFADSTIVYKDASTCMDDADCECGKCIGGICRVDDDSDLDSHTQKVASRITSSAGGQKFHAASAGLYIANSFESQDPVNWAESFQWMSDNNVLVVNTSWNGGGSPLRGYSAFDHLVDWYSYVPNIFGERMTFVKSAGNSGAGLEPYVTCDAQSALCVGSMKANQTWGPNDYLDDTLDTRSSWWNPIDPLMPNPQRRRPVEKPDLVAEGEDGLVLSSNGTDEWIEASGPGKTSFAAPVITGLAALLQSKCKGNNSTSFPLWPEEVRSLMRNFAFVDQSYEGSGLDFYKPGTVTSGPSVGYSVDYKHGVGVVASPSLEYWTCRPPPPAPPPVDPPPAGIDEVFDGRGDAEQDGNGIPVPPWLQDSSSADNNNKQTLKAGSTMILLESLGAVPAGARVRASFSVAPCPNLDKFDNNNPGMPSMDFDLLAASLSDEKFVAASDSLVDANEGFDVILTEAVDNLEIFYLRPTVAQWCTGVDYRAHSVLLWEVAP